MFTNYLSVFGANLQIPSALRKEKRMPKENKSEIKRALCFGCWLQAGVLATVENGKLVKLKGEPGHPVNQGYICERSKAFIEHLYHEDCLNYPLKRVGDRGEGRWEKITWEYALDEVAEKLSQFKAESGAESFACIFPHHIKAKRKGTKYIVIDPKYSETAGRLADKWLKLRPGTDAALALGWLNVIIEEKLYDKDFVDTWCHGFKELQERVNRYPTQKVAEITGLPEPDIVESARIYATSKPASIIWGVKSDMQGRNVTGITQAKCIIRAITGNLDVIGGDMLSGPCEKANYGAMLEHMDELPADQRKNNWVRIGTGYGVFRDMNW